MAGGVLLTTAALVFVRPNTGEGVEIVAHTALLLVVAGHASHTDVAMASAGKSSCGGGGGVVSKMGCTHTHAHLYYYMNKYILKQLFQTYT